MQNNLNLSIIIPCYNHEKYITETIESIWEQNLESMEIIAIDDGSNDNSYAILQELKKNSPIPMYIEKQINMGVTKTLNKALKKAKGKFLMTIASDDKYEPNSLSKMIECIESDNAIKIVIANGHNFQANTKSTHRVHTSYTMNLLSKTPLDIKNEILVSVPRPLLTQASIFDRKMLMEIGGWDEEIKLDDWPLNIKIFSYLASHNYKHLYYDFDVILYRDHEQQTHKDEVFNFQMIEEVIYKYTPKEKRKEFVSTELYFRAKILRQQKKIKQMNQVLFKSITINPSIYNIYKSLELFIKSKLSFSKYH